MNIDQARVMRTKGDISSAEILPTPSKDGGWLMTILDISGKTYLMVDSQDRVITTSTVDEMLNLVRSIGLRVVSVRIG